MKRGTLVPITGSVLKWAVNESGYRVEEVAERLKVDAATLRRWEKETERPGLTAFKQLAHVLKRPTALFFLPEPPRQSVRHPAFRANPGTDRRTLLPAEALSIRRAVRIQEAVAWILEETDAPPVTLGAERLEGAPDTMRALLGVPVEAQRRWQHTSEAVRRWRHAVESRGVLVFLFSMGGEACRGFSLWNSRAPVIVLNTAFNPGARVFTLFHELAHLLTRSDSVCVGVPTFRGDPDERRCEEFSANFLLPEGDLRRAVEEYWTKRGKGRAVDFETVRWAAGSFKVSLRATALAFIRRGLARQDLYREIDAVAKTDSDKGGGGAGGERRPEKRAREYGQRAAALLLRGADEGLLGPHDLADYFQLPLSEVDEIRGKIA